MIIDTREKLLEAKYFLERMKENQPDRDAFKYNLSAFLAAGRSVTFVMQREFSATPGFKKWYDEKNLGSDETMTFFNNKRVMTIHQQPVQPGAHVNVSISGQVILSSKSISAVVTHADGTVERIESEPTPEKGRKSGLMPPPEPTKTEVTTEWRWYLDDLPEKDVVTVCEEYIAKLETLVAECESLFSRSRGS